MDLKITTTDYLSLLTCSTRREVYNIVKELTNGFDEYLSKLVHEDIKETSRICQIGKCVFPFINMRYFDMGIEIMKYIDEIDSCFDCMTGVRCCETLYYELIGNFEDDAKDDNELYYTFGKICIDKSNSAPFSFRLKDFNRDRILSLLSVANEESSVIITRFLNAFEELGTVEIDDIEPPRGLTFAMEILENRPLVKDKTVNSEPATLESILPDELKTGEVIKYYKRAIDNGFMEQKNNRLQWNAGQVRLGYFCSKVYQQPRPISKLEKLFEVSRLGASISQAENNESKRADTIQWRKQIDDVIFFD